MSRVVRGSRGSDSKGPFYLALPIVMLVLGFLGATACSMTIYAYKDLTRTRPPDRNTKTILYVQIGLMVFFVGLLIAALATCAKPDSTLSIDM
jgi:uncharacterized membrane protein YidH (DUF202 family)